MRLLPTWSNFSWNSACHQFWNSNGLCFMAMDYYASWHWTTPLHQSKSIINTPQPIWGLLINEAVSPAKTHCPTCWPDFRVELAQSVWTGLLVLLFHPTVKWYLFLQDAHIYIYILRKMASTGSFLRMNHASREGAWNKPTTKLIWL